MVGAPVMKPTRNITLASGRPGQLYCRVSGYPLPEITWYLAGEGVENLGFDQLRNGTLHMTAVDKSQKKGPYICKARNIYGEATSSETWITVLGKNIISENGS